MARYTCNKFKLHITTVEIAFGDRPFEITQADNPDHVQLRTIDELWHKENMINVGAQRLTENINNWKYMAWIDSDIHFQHPRWLEETIEALQHYEVVQMWEDAIDLGPNHQMIQCHKSFMSQYLKGAPPGPHYTHWHPGFAWACTRGAFDALGGLIDFAILGAGDNHMAHGLIDKMPETFAPGVTKAYQTQLLAWQKRAHRYVKQDVGYVPGTILHSWHGKKKDRKYWDRWKILTTNKFDPGDDLKRDAQGLWQLETWTKRQKNLRDQIRAYFRGRSEDSVDVD